MNIKLFYHSVISGWNHGNVHFLRGVAGELIRNGHKVTVYEPVQSWSRQNLVLDQGLEVIDEFKKTFPRLIPEVYHKPEDIVDQLEGADLVIVHEWNDPELVAYLGSMKEEFGYRLIFHDTHHRSVSAPAEMRQYDLSNYDGVLAFGQVISDLYLRKHWTTKAWTWHEAADTRIFRPLVTTIQEGDLVWVGNWGDDERTAELLEYLVKPVHDLKLKARVYGVRYPKSALNELDKAGIEYGGYLPSHRVPEIFSRFKVTVHVPRRPYQEMLPGIPTIRPFEAMACGLPLVCSPWKDSEGLFTEGQDYLMAESGEEMKKKIRSILSDAELSGRLVNHGLKTIRENHTCSHRAQQLMKICHENFPELF
jgi:spore maturation protein CgeB